MPKSYLFIVLTILLAACVDSSRNELPMCDHNQNLTEIDVKAVDYSTEKCEDISTNKTNNSTGSNNTNSFFSLLFSFSIGALSASVITAIIFRKRLSKL